jgi:hypothetical protein
LPATASRGDVGVVPPSRSDGLENPFAPRHSRRHAEDLAVSVRWVGAQRDVLGGDTRGKIALASLVDRPHPYALGPRAGVSGEVTILDGVPWIARVLDGRLEVEQSFDHAACFLVYAEVGRTFRLEHLCMIGWQLFAEAGVVQWCDHDHHFLVVPHAGGERAARAPILREAA